MADDLTTPRSRQGGARPPRGSRKVAEPHFLESCPCLFGLAAPTLVALALTVGGLPAHALGPAAPFTPPAAVATAASAVAAAGAPTIDLIGNPAGSESAAALLPGLAGLRLGKSPMALIDGQWWRPGDRPRGALLAAVHPTGAVLRHADGRIEQLAWPGDGSVVSATSTTGAAKPQPRTSPATGNQPTSTPR